MFFKLLLLFVVVPAVELVILFELADATSWPVTLAVILLTGIAGTWLAKREGFRTIRHIRAELAEGRMPTDSLVDAAMILVAGALLLAPGLLTDCFGLSLLVPICRRFYRRRLQQWFKTNFRVTSFTATRTRTTDDGSQVIDSYVVEPPPERLE